LHTRIAQVISDLGLKKVAFAKKLGLSQPFVSELCSGKSKPSDRTISDICREFGVDELWLRYGDGDMFVQKHPNEEIEGFMMDVLRGDDGFKRRFARMVARLTEEEWEILERKMRELMEE